MILPITTKTFCFATTSKCLYLFDQISWNMTDIFWLFEGSFSEIVNCWLITKYRELSIGIFEKR